MIAIKEFKYHDELHHFSGYWLDLDSQQVWSEKYKKWMKPWKNRDGYVCVRLTDINKKQLTDILLSRLVWTMANGRQIPDGYQVNHIDEDKNNNNPSNLELVTAKENSNHGTRNARVAAAMRGKKKTPEHVAKVAAAQSKAVAQLTLDGQLVQTWPSTMEAGRNGWDQGTVSKCCNKCFHRQGNDVYKGYRWMWLDECKKQG